MLQPNHQFYTYAYLYKLSGNTDFIQKMITLFVSSLDEYTVELRQLLQSKDISELKKVIHKMYPSMMNMKVQGAEELHSLLTEETVWHEEITVAVQRLIDIFITIKPLMEKDLEQLSND